MSEHHQTWGTSCNTCHEVIKDGCSGYHNKGYCLKYSYEEFLHFKKGERATKVIDDFNKYMTDNIYKPDKEKIEAQYKELLKQEYLDIAEKYKNKSMTIQEIIQSRKQAEAKISDILNKLREETECYCDSVDIDFTTTVRMGELPETREYFTRIDLRLPK